MAEKKSAMLIFTKPPIPGLVKTRLTAEYGGFFTEEQAAQFYRCCFYDVCEMAMTALGELQAANDELVAADPTADRMKYDFFCSTTPADSLPQMEELFKRGGNWPMEVNFLVDTGHNFDEHFNDACDQLFAMGYESLVAIAGDVPTMPKNHIVQSFQWLEYFQAIGQPGFVYAPCQESGTSLIGYSHNTPGMNHTGIYYNMDGRSALEGYLIKIQEAGIPSAYFEPVADIDEVTDLGHAVSCMRAIKEAARWQGLFVPRRTLALIDLMGITVTTPPNDNHDPRDYLDGEPPELGPDAIAEGMAALREKQRQENAYEASKYN